MGKTRMEPRGSPREASAAEMPRRPISVAVSKAEAEEDAERVHVPTAADHRENGAKDAGEKATIVEEEVEILVDVGLAAADAPEGGVDGVKDEEVDDRDAEKEERRDAGADHSTDGAVVVEVFLQAEGEGGEAERAENDDGGVAEGEHESDGDGALALLHELAGDVVDGGDVVGVDGVAEAEAVGEQRGTEQEGVVAEGDGGPEPGAGIEDEEEAVDADDFAAKISGCVVEKGAEAGTGGAGCAGGRRGERAGGDLH